MKNLWMIISFLENRNFTNIFNSYSYFYEHRLNIFHSQFACIIYSRKYLQSIENNLIKNPTYLRSRIRLKKKNVHCKKKF